MNLTQKTEIAFEPPFG